MIDSVRAAVVVQLHKIPQRDVILLDLAEHQLATELNIDTTPVIKGMAKRAINKPYPVNAIPSLFQRSRQPVR